MCDPLSAAIGIGGLGLSYMQGKEAEDRYEAEADYRAGQTAKAEAEAQRAYRANLANYETAKQTYQSNVDYLNKLINDPTAHPEYESTKKGLKTEMKGMRDTLKASLRRRGRTGGIQDKILADLETTYEGKLTDIYTEISKGAVAQKLALQKPNQPYLGQGKVDYSGSMQAAMIPAISADLTGFGEMYALSRLMDKTSSPSTLAKTGESLSPYYAGFDYDTIRDWAGTDW